MVSELDSESLLGTSELMLTCHPLSAALQGLSSRWMMGNRESREKIKGKQSLKSPRWTQCPSNPWTCIRVDSEETCVKTNTLSSAATSPNTSQAMNAWWTFTSLRWGSFSISASTLTSISWFCTSIYWSGFFVRVERKCKRNIGNKTIFSLCFISSCDVFCVR